jgi:catechol 2,3-dioxygenase-like lactoylglutathione lyase family enzyme
VSERSFGSTCGLDKVALHGDDGWMSHLGLVSLLVREYDEAIAFYVDLLGFDLIEDTPVDDQKRWVVVAPSEGRETRLLLARAVTDDQRARIGNQTGGRVFLFLYTDHFLRDYRRLQEVGIRFVESPREEPYGTVAVFEDLYGNRWDLIEPRSGTDSS